jgi:hypothetical protein
MYDAYRTSLTETIIQPVGNGEESVEYRLIMERRELEKLHKLANPTDTPPSTNRQISSTWRTTVVKAATTQRIIGNVCRAPATS